MSSSETFWPPEAENPTRAVRKAPTATPFTPATPFAPGTPSTPGIPSTPGTPCMFATPSTTASTATTATTVCSGSPERLKRGGGYLAVWGFCLDQGHPDHHRWGGGETQLAADWETASCPFCWGSTRKQPWKFNQTISLFRNKNDHYQESSSEPLPSSSTPPVPWG